MKKALILSRKEIGDIVIMSDSNLYLLDLIYPLLLSIGSSTDNFTVGASLGLSSKPLHIHVNLIISIANATGALISCAGGQFLELFLFQGLPPILAGLAFLYLAYDEYQSCSISLIDYFRQQTEATSKTSQDKESKKGEVGNSPLGHSTVTNTDILRLAIPMTLNNLAGGVAGGAAGVQPLVIGFMAFVASFGMMLLGHYLGFKLGSAINQKLDTHIISCAIFAGLAVVSFMDYWS